MSFYSVFVVLLFVLQSSSRFDLCIVAVVNSFRRVSCSWHSLFHLSLCLVNYDLSLCVGLCATSILSGLSSFVVISDVPFM